MRIILEIMHFGDELVDADELKFPKKGQARPREIEMAKKLIDGMTTDWDPDKYKDEYKTQLMAMIEEKVKHPNEKHEAPKAPKKASNVIDLMSVLEESLARTKGGKAKASAPKSKAKAAESQAQEGRLGYRSWPSARLKFVEPMKAAVAAAPPYNGQWLYEVKFDGFRVLAIKNGKDVELWSRNEKPLNERFPEVVKAVAKSSDQKLHARWRGLRLG